MSILVAIYVCLIVYTILIGEFLYSALIMLTIPFLVLFFAIKKKSDIKKTKEKIELAKTSDIKPFIKVNKTQWYILELVPGVSAVAAKTIHNGLRRKKRIENFTDFANLTSLPLQNYELAKKILIF